MKNLLITIIISLLTTSLISQSPYLFNYQALVKDDLGEILSMQNIGLKFVVLDAEINGNELYTEEHQTSSSASGVINLRLGEGSDKTGSMEAINWANGEYFIKIELDENGGTNYDFVDLRRFISVPYALHAETVTNTNDDDADPNNEIQTLSFNAISNELTISDGNTVSIPSGGTDADADPTNEIQDLSVAKTGNQVDLGISHDGLGVNFNTDDADADPTNELQTLGLNNNSLSLSMGNQIDLSPFSTPWKPSSSWDAHGIYYWGDVYMDTVQVDYELRVGDNNPFGTQIFNREIFMNDSQNQRNLELSAQKALFRNGNESIYSKLDKDSLVFIRSNSGPGLEEKGIYSSFGYFFENGLNALGATTDGVGMADEHFVSFLAPGSLDLREIMNDFDAVDKFSLVPDSLIMFNDNEIPALQLGVDENGHFGYLDLFDEEGNINLSLGSTLLFQAREHDSKGGLLLYSNDLPSVQLESLDDGGFLQMYRRDGSMQSLFGADEFGRGTLSLHDLDGNDKINLNINENGVAGIVVDGGLRINDPAKNILCSGDFWGYTIWDPEDGILGGLEQNFMDPNSGKIYINGANRLTNFLASFNWMDDYKSGGLAGVFGNTGVIRAGMKVTADEKGTVFGHRLSVHGPSGFERGILRTREDHDAGSLILYGPNGSFNVSLDYHPDNHNYGDMRIFDQNGHQRAGFFINPTTGNGEVFADVKHFRVDHANDKNKEIWYASLEGPEAAAYLRGTSSLSNGEARIEFPDHFIQVSSAENMTIMLTPLYWDTYGLAVIEKNANGFIVKELKGGTGDFGFDWEVKCVRKGYENYEIIREKDPGLPNVGRNSESINRKMPSNLLGFDRDRH